MSYELSAISYELSAMSYQLSAVSYQLSAISYQLEAESYGMNVKFAFADTSPRSHGQRNQESLGCIRALTRT